MNSKSSHSIILPKLSDSFEISFYFFHISKNSHTPIQLFSISDSVSLSILVNQRIELIIPSKNHSSKVGLVSTSTVPLKKWTKIVVKVSPFSIKMLMDNNMEAESSYGIKSQSKLSTFTLGGTDHRRTGECFVDNLEIKKLTRETFDQHSADSKIFGGVKLGCLECGFQESLNACGKNTGWHICSRQEVLGGAWQIARKYGWLRWVGNFEFFSPGLL